MELIKEVETKLRDGTLRSNPHECADLRAKLSGEYSFLMGQLEEILLRKPSIWNEIRPKFKSDTACERAWESTESGINEAGLRLRIKRCEKMFQGLNGLIRLAEGESKNLY